MHAACRTATPRGRAGAALRARGFRRRLGRAWRRARQGAPPAKRWRSCTALAAPCPFRVGAGKGENQRAWMSPGAPSAPACATPPPVGMASAPAPARPAGPGRGGRRRRGRPRSPGTARCPVPRLAEHADAPPEVRAARRTGSGGHASGAPPSPTRARARRPTRTPPSTGRTGPCGGCWRPERAGRRGGASSRMPGVRAGPPKGRARPVARLGPPRASGAEPARVAEALVPGAGRAARSPCRRPVSAVSPPRSGRGGRATRRPHRRAGLVRRRTCDQRSPRSSLKSGWRQAARSAASGGGRPPPVAPAWLLGAEAGVGLPGVGFGQGQD